MHSPDTGFIHGGYLVDNYVGSASFFFFVVAAAEPALAGRGVFPAWYRWLSGLVAVLSILIWMSLGVSGFFSPYGGGSTIPALAVFVWVLAGSVVLWRGPRTTAGAEAVGATSTGRAARA